MPPRILSASTDKVAKAREERKNRWRRARGLILFLRYTGLRISDAVGCEAGRLVNDKLFLYTQKTGQHVYCPLPEFVMKELEALPRVSDHYWFWTGVGSLETARKKWSEALAALFADANLKDGHRTSFSRYVRGRIAEGWDADRASLDPARPCKRQDHREALQPVESSTAGASGTGREAVLGE